MYRVVLDTNEIVAAGTQWVSEAFKPRQDAQRLICNIVSGHVGLICGKIAGEYVEKLVDGGHRPAWVTQLIGYLLEAFERVNVCSTSCSPRPRDPDDEVFLLCAIDGTADLLVSEDKDLLSLQEAYERPSILCRAAALPILCEQSDSEVNP